MISKNLDTFCGSKSVITELSYFNTGFSMLLMITSVPLNLIVLVTIIKQHHFFHRSFYSIIANIAAADLLCGLITCAFSINFNLKEAFGTTIIPLEWQSLHYTFFVFNSVSVLSMALLSIDRLGVLLNPIQYYNVMTKSRTIILIVFIWIASFAVSTVYFDLGLIRYLLVFSVTTIAMTMVIMIATLGVFRQRLSESKKAEMSRMSPTPRGSIDVGVPKGVNKRQTLHNFTQMDKRVTTTFLIMLCLFLLNYLPAVVIAVYMNICGGKCNCQFVHVMRDVIFLFILSSGLCRVLNFIVRLTILKEAVKSWLVVRKSPPPNGLEFGAF